MNGADEVVPSYSIRLVSSLYRGSLLDRLQFLHFIVSLLESRPALAPGDQLGQLSFAVSLIDGYLDDILESEPETARLVGGCMSRIQEVSDSLSKRKRGIRRML